MRIAITTFRAEPVPTFLPESQPTFLVQGHSAWALADLENDSMNWTNVDLAWYAIAGSVLAELVVVYQYLSRDKRVPARYRITVFYVIRASIALGAGVCLKSSASKPRTAPFHWPL